MALLPDGPHHRTADIAGCVPERQFSCQLIDHLCRDGRVVLNIVVVALVTGEWIGASQLPIHQKRASIGVLMFEATLSAIHAI